MVPLSPLSPPDPLPNSSLFSATPPHWVPLMPNALNCTLKLISSMRGCGGRKEKADRPITKSHWGHQQYSLKLPIFNEKRNTVILNHIYLFLEWLNAKQCWKGSCVLKHVFPDHSELQHLYSLNKYILRFCLLSRGVAVWSSTVEESSLEIVLLIRVFLG